MVDVCMDGWMIVISRSLVLIGDFGLVCSVLQERSSGVSLSFPVTLETRWTWDASTSEREK